MYHEEAESLVLVLSESEHGHSVCEIYVFCFPLVLTDL